MRTLSLFFLFVFVSAAHAQVVAEIWQLPTGVHWQQWGDPICDTGHYNARGKIGNTAGTFAVDLSVAAMTPEKVRYYERMFEYFGIRAAFNVVGGRLILTAEAGDSNSLCITPDGQQTRVTVVWNMY